jgi:hypothetical protein
MTPRAKRRAYLREAVLMLMLARVAVRVVPAARLFAFVDRPMKRVCRFATGDADWVAWAIGESTRFPGLTATPCLPQALAAHVMLRRRGIPSRLCLGVTRHNDAVAAHAWVETGERSIVGGAEAAGFTELAAFGRVA